MLNTRLIHSRFERISAIATDAATTVTLALLGDMQAADRNGRNPIVLDRATPVLCASECASKPKSPNNAAPRISSALAVGVVIPTTIATASAAATTDTTKIVVLSLVSRIKNGVGWGPVPITSLAPNRRVADDETEKSLDKCHLSVTSLSQSHARRSPNVLPLGSASLVVHSCTGTAQLTFARSGTGPHPQFFGAPAAG